MVRKIDINCDMGESFGIYQLGNDSEVMKYITSANIACMFHAGDPLNMKKTVKLAEESGVKIGAHPSYFDILGFGRRKIEISPDQLKADIIYQIGALSAFTKDGSVQHVKPHGAMYNVAVNDAIHSKNICEAILEINPNLILVALTGSSWVDIATEMGVRVAREAFIDRAVNSDGSLVSRSIEGAVLHDVDKIVERTLSIVNDGFVNSISGEEVQIKADTICIHGDTPNASEIARLVNLELTKSGIQIHSMDSLV